jgi:hypothetical protein
LEDGDYVYLAGGNTGTSNSIQRWEIGDPDEEFKELLNEEDLHREGGAGTETAVFDDAGTGGEDFYYTALEIINGTLYALASDGTDSVLITNLNPTSSSPNIKKLCILGVDFGVMPSALYSTMSSDSTTLYAVDLTGATIMEYTDTLAGDVAPSLILPADGYVNPINPISGVPSNVALQWARPSDGVENYDLSVYADADGDVALIDGEDVEEDGKTVVQLVGDVADFEVPMTPGATYYWRVRADAPTRSSWSEMRSFTIEDADSAAGPPIIIEQAPAPVINIPAPPPPIVIEQVPAPVINIPAPPPAQQIVIPPAAAPTTITPAYIYAIIVIGAVLVIAVIVLIVRTRRAI